jgi:hypothetical protein
MAADVRAPAEQTIVGERWVEARPSRAGRPARVVCAGVAVRAFLDRMAGEPAVGFAAVAGDDVAVVALLVGVERSVAADRGNLGVAVVGVRVGRMLGRGVVANVLADVAVVRNIAAILDGLDFGLGRIEDFRCRLAAVAEAFQADSAHAPGCEKRNREQRPLEGTARPQALHPSISSALPEKRQSNCGEA